MSKSKKSLALRYAFIFLRLAFIDIQIKENNSLKYSIQNLQYGALSVVSVFNFRNFLVDWKHKTKRDCQTKLLNLLLSIAYSNNFYLLRPNHDLLSLIFQVWLFCYAFKLCKA